LLLFPALTLIITIAIWPASWSNPVEFFHHHIGQSANFSWHGKLIYMGGFIDHKTIPWHYVPVWIGVTTPIVYLVLFAAGTACQCIRMSQQFCKKQISENWVSDGVFLVIIFAPIIVSIAIGAVIQGGWRYFFFAFPFMLLVGLQGAQWIWEQLGKFRYAGVRRLFRGSLVVMIAAQMIWIFVWMIRNHPMQQVYFNCFAGDPAENFDRDYMRTSYKAGLDHLIEHVEGDIVFFLGHAQQRLMPLNASLLKPEDRKRIHFTVDPARETHRVSELRNIQGNDYQMQGWTKIHAVTVDEFEVLPIYEREK